MSSKSYILSISCPDARGIVASVTNCLSKHLGFIIESSQFGDPFSQKFFMRIVFTIPSKNISPFLKAFESIKDNFNMEYSIQNLEYKPKVLMMVSKASHCLNDLLHRYHSGSLAIEVPAIVSNHKDLETIANWYGIDFYYLPFNELNRSEQEHRVLDLFKKLRIDIVVLARYMQILTSQFCQSLPGKIINIHHSFLPSFKGAKPYHQAFERGVKIIGATAHYVTENLDEGPIIDQETIKVNHSHNPSELIDLGKDVESFVLARALKLHIEKRVIITGNKTVVFER